MHESSLVADLIEEVARRAAGERVRSISLHVGAMAAASEAALRHGMGDSAEARWGYRPAVNVTFGEDPLDPGAQGIELRSITVGGS